MSLLTFKFEDVTLLEEEFEDFSFDLDIVKLSLPVSKIDSNYLFVLSNNCLEEANIFSFKFRQLALQYKL
jgi:patatin-like phospholipase/acyl hydrolase